MKVYVYHETNDNEPFGGMLTMVFASKKDAENCLRNRVEQFFGLPWNECEKIADDEDAQFFPTYVEYADGNGYNFFAIDEHNLIGFNEFKDGNFIDDKEKMRDFRQLTKEEFLQSYSYLTEEEYDNTKEALNG